MVTAFVRRRASAGIVAALILLAVSGCDSSPELDALKDDPIARYEPPGGQLVDTHVIRFFIDGQQQAQLDAVLRAASQAGWDVSDDPVSRFKGSLTRMATKQLPSGCGRLSVSVFTNGSIGTIASSSI